MIASTRPASPDRAAQYREQGYWLTARAAADYHRHLAGGGDRVALIDAESVWNYQQLAAAVGAVRGALATAGVRPGDAVLVIAPLRNGAAAAYLAALYSGAVAVLLDRRCGPADIDNACAAAAPTVTLAFTADVDELALAERCPVLDLERVLAQPSNVPVAGTELLDPDAPALVVFTSGTTSTPKGVMHTLNSLRCGIANMTAALRVTGDDAFFLPSPLASITGVLQLHTALAAHGRVLLEDRFHPQSSLAAVLRHGATIFGGVPIIAEELFTEADRQGLATLPLRCIAVGGSMIGDQVIERARRIGINPVRIYGSSEAPMSTATALGADAASADDGSPLPGVAVELDQNGELLVRGPHQFHGYLDDEHNESGFCGEWVRTGDRAQLIDGQVRITGRLKDIAVRKGMKISLAEIDLAAAGLGDCGAYTVPDPDTGERVELAIHAPDDSDLTYTRVVAHLTTTGLAKWKLPEQILLWRHPLPRTETGKVIRARLREADDDCRILPAPRLAPNTGRKKEI